MAVAQGRALRRGVSEPVRAVGQTEISVQVPVYRHGAAGEGSAPAYRLDLQGQVLQADGAVLVDGALELKREDQVQLLARAGNKRGSPAPAPGPAAPACRWARRAAGPANRRSRAPRTAPASDPSDGRRCRSSPPADTTHRPLHRGPRIALHARSHEPSSPHAKRTLHSLQPPDISSANQAEKLS